MVLLLGVSKCVTPASGSSPPLSTVPVALRLDTLEDRTLTVGGLRGSLVVITVIYTWADLALVEVPRFKALYAKYDPKDLVIVTIALDENLEMLRIFQRT